MAKTSARASKTSRTADKTTEEAVRPAPRTSRPRAARRGSRLPAEVDGAVRAAREKKAVDLVVLDLRKAGGFTDYFVICTGMNARQIAAIADAVRETLRKDYNERPALAEGVEKSEWILLDYFNFVVHIFSRECRAFYGLERLWGAAERHVFADDERAEASRG